MKIWWPQKGSWSHSTPDWLVDNLAYGSGQNNGSGGSSSIQLFNNDSASHYFYLYGFQFNDFSSEQVYAQVSAGPIGTAWGNCYPVIADRGQPPGQIRTGKTPAGADLISIPWTWQGNQPTAPYFSPFPMAVIPPGYGFLVYSGFTASAIIATFWYVWR
jgi:hypothetical protein